MRIVFGQMTNPANVTHLFMTGFFFLFGSFLGSFCNVVILRMASGVSVIFPPSSCPKCGHRLSALDLIPVFGWILLGGRCRYCRVPISWQYPVVEATISFLVGSAFYVHGFSPYLIPTAALGIFWLIVAVLVLRGEVWSPRPALYAWAFLVLFSILLKDPLLASRTLFGVGSGLLLSLPAFLRGDFRKGLWWFSLLGFSCAGVWPILGILTVFPHVLAALAANLGGNPPRGGWPERAQHTYFLTQIAFLLLLSLRGFWPL